MKQKGKSILRAHNLANTDVAAAVVAVRAWQMPALTKPEGCTDWTKQLSCSIYITLNMLVKLQQEGKVRLQFRVLGNMLISRQSPRHRQGKKVKGNSQALQTDRECEIRKINKTNKTNTI